MDIVDLAIAQMDFDIDFGASMSVGYTGYSGSSYLWAAVVASLAASAVA